MFDPPVSARAPGSGHEVRVAQVMIPSLLHNSLLFHSSGIHSAPSEFRMSLTSGVSHSVYGVNIEGILGS